jgi:cytoskeleton protein RodZ
MTSIGETLRRERTKRGLDLKTVSNELKISLKFLEAIEADAFDKLPGGMFTKSFVRQYARYLGLDEDDMATELDHIVEPAPPVLSPKAEAEIEVPRMQEWQALNDRFSWSSWLPTLAMFVVAMLVCSGVYSWWQRSKASANAAAQIQTSGVTHTLQARPPASEPAQQQPQQSQPQGSPAETAAPAQANPAPATPPSPAPAQTNPAPPPTAPQTATQQAATPGTHQDVGSADRPAPEPAVPGATANNAAPPATPTAPGPVHVELTANEPVWVLVQTDGKYSFSGTLEANQTRAVDATSKVILRIGNAGGVTISLNGKPIGPVGAKGQVKTIQLTSGGWTAAVSKPALPVDDIL